jgi:hypothetical protein
MMKKRAILSALLILIISAAFSQEPDSLKTIFEKNGNNDTIQTEGKRQKKEKKEKNEDKEFQTLLGHNRPGGGYGAFSLGYSLIDGRQAILFGGKVAWIASHSIGFGFGGTGFINEFHYETLLDRDVALAGGYGGFYIEPILMPRFPVHLSFPILFGGGGISYVSKDSFHSDNLIEESEAFLIIEPGAEIELNLTRYFRFAFGATYRFPTAFNIGLADNSSISAKSIEGMSYTVTFKFGKF